MTASEWVPDLDGYAGPIYVRIVEAIADDIEHGKLRVGERLPPQRMLAAQLGVDFTTISRAYTEAQRRGLTEAQVGRGTFIRQQSPSIPISAPDALIDMTVNHPPALDDPDIEQRMWRDVMPSTSDSRLDRLMRYVPPAGAARDRAAGAQWLAQRLEGVTADRLVVCPGTQGALLVVTMMLASRGDVICVEELTYPGFILLARQLGVRVVPVAMDRHGALPDALADVCRQYRPKAFYCMPTLHNPTAVTMPSKRREAIAGVLRRYQVPAIEDDNYWPFATGHEGEAPAAPPPLASFLPELTFYLSGLSKCATPALRIAYLVAPARHDADQAAVAIRATASMASPLNASLATRWIEDGTVTDVLAAIRRETAERQALARRILPVSIHNRDARTFHLWLDVPSPWTRMVFADQLRASNVAVALSDAFSIASGPEAIRICLGGPTDRADLEYGLQRIAWLLTSKSRSPSIIV
jgi:DNA-binding transcriptional MocR family regulator